MCFKWLKTISKTFSSISHQSFSKIISYPTLKKNHIPGDFRFVIIHRVYNQNMGFKFKERMTMNFYNIIKHLGITETRAYGLDTSNVNIESVPLVIKTEHKNRIKRAELV